MTSEPLDLDAIEQILAHPLEDRPWRDIVRSLVAEVQRCAQDSRDMLAELWRLREQQAESYEEGWRDGHKCAERCSDVPCPAEARADQAEKVLAQVRDAYQRWTGRPDVDFDKAMRRALGGASDDE